MGEKEMISVNGRQYSIQKLLGKGKGGYSYLATDGERNVVVKQIHHEPCDYYQFGNKIESEVRDYGRLHKIGIAMPEMLDVDFGNERIVKEYIDGKDVYEMVWNDELPACCMKQVKRMCELLYRANTNIDYFPTNFILQNDVLYYVDYECNDYMDEWNFENWGAKYWAKTKEFFEYAHTRASHENNESEEVKFLKGYMRDDTLRHELNDLTREIFGFDFENWVTKGYFEGDYIPYSYEKDGRMIANVSVNRMEFIQNGKAKNYIQLGTVMTREAYRGRGYARALMERVLADYAGKCDGIYLFANLNALGFYDKMGFSEGVQYRYTLKDEVRERLQKEADRKVSEDCFCPVGSSEQFHKNRYMEMVRHSAVQAALEQKNKFGLQMFYTSGMEEVYYNRKLDGYIVLEKQENILYLQRVICAERLPLEQVLTYIQGKYEKIILGFAPCGEDIFLCSPEIYDGEEDYRLLFYGEGLRDMEAEKLYFPLLSHA